MEYDAIRSGKRKAVNVTLDTGIVAAAREHGINLSQISEAALGAAAKKAANDKWRKDNRAWAESVNEWVEENGLPLQRYRLF